MERTSDGQGREADGFASFDCHLDSLQVSVHRNVHPNDSAMNNRAVLQLDRYRLAGQLHQKSGGKSVHSARREEMKRLFELEMQAGHKQEITGGKGNVM